MIGECHIAFMALDLKNPNKAVPIGAHLEARIEVLNFTFFDMTVAWACF